MGKVLLKYSFLFIVLISSKVVLSQDKISVTPVSFNSPEREYAPVYYNNGLVFTGVNRNNEGLTYIDEETGKQLSDLYYIPLSEDSFGIPTLLSKELKSSFHDGPITFSKDAATAYFTRSQFVNKKLKNNTKIINKLGIYKATFNGEIWTNIQPCSFNSEEYNTGQPSLSNDGSRIYFVSDKEGGFGGVDLYYADITDSICGSMINLGKQINSSANELFPFIDNSNKLYYSSNKPNGFGGLDIYTSKNINEKWNDSYLMDSTINSSFDDFSIVFNENQTEGYFCSNKAGSDDIYKIAVTYPEFKDCEKLINELLCYEFYEEATLNADSVAMTYEWDFGDGIKERSLETYHCYEKPGFYIVELNIMDPMIGANFINEATYELEIEAVIQPEVISPDTISDNTDFQVLINQGSWEAYQIENYYIDYGDSTTTKNDTASHQYKTPGFKELKILISGYDKTSKEIKTNCFYKTIYVTNDTVMIVSGKRFLEELEYAGFNTDELEEIEDGVFMLEIISSSESVKGDSTILKEFTNKVREVYDTNTHSFSYVLGQTKSPFNLINDFRDAHNNGFNDAIVKSYHDGRMKIEDLGLAYDNESGEVNIVLNNIQFEYNGHLLDNKSKIELEKLTQYLRDNKDVKIEIGAHTDASRNVEKAKQLFAARGQIYSKAAHDKMSGGYNLKLSQKRAQSVVSYLNSVGIELVRLKPKGYGETHPLAPNTNSDGSDNPNGRKKNRRVSFKILQK